MSVQPRSPAPARSCARAPLPLEDLLAAVDRRRGTRLELVCWQLDVEEQRAAPAWELALTERGDRARRLLLRPRRSRAR